MELYRRQKAVSYTHLDVYKRQVVFSLTGWSPLIPSRFLVARCTLDTAMSALLSLTGLSPSLVCFPKTVLLELLNQLCGPNPGMHALRFGLFPFRSPLLWKSIFLSLPPATQMFQFTGFPSIRYGLAYGYMRYSHVGFPIQTFTDQWIFAPPRDFSQLITSFIGSQCQGIHPALFFA